MRSELSDQQGDRLFTETRLAANLFSWRSNWFFDSVSVRPTPCAGAYAASKFVKDSSPKSILKSILPTKTRVPNWHKGLLAEAKGPSLSKKSLHVHAVAVCVSQYLAL